MLGTNTEPWILLSLLAFSVTVTLSTNWLAGGCPRPAWPRRLKAVDAMAAAASLIWILLIFAGGVIASRYIERVARPGVGYLLFGLVAFLLSLARAFLFRRARTPEESPTWTDRQTAFKWLVHNSTYVLFAIALYLLTSWLLRRNVLPLLLVPLCVGAMLPDLDSQRSVLGRLLPPVSRRLETRLGHGQQWHSLAACLLIALITAPIAAAVRIETWLLIPVGFASHLVLDTLTPEGVMLFWPLSHRRYSLLGGVVSSEGSSSERKLAAGLTIVVAVLLFLVDIGPPPPPQVVALSYQQTLERYYSMRGRNLVFACVEGSWQATGRRISARFEVLNASGSSFVMLDRYDGRVFSAGREASDNLYLDRITLEAGASTRIKPVELHLEGHALTEALPVVYQMQREPGLQHIYISGELTVPARLEVEGPALPLDYSQTSLRRIQSQRAGHYSLHYLTAAELIELANVEVEAADLVIVGTYVSASADPTVTPLPPPPTMEPGS
jgi:inner membrane protein